MPTLFIRAPFEAGAASPAPAFTAAEDAAAMGRLTVTIDPADANRLKLLPAFPGRLTFKPTAPLASDKPIIGNLYLEIAPAALLELAKVLPDLNYPFLLIYHGVQLSDAFFDGTVKTATIASFHPGTPTATYDQKKDAFKRGLLSVNIAPNKTSANCTLPTVQKNSANQYVITLELSVRMTENPYASPADLALTTTLPADIVHPSRFLPIPIAYFYKAFRSLTNAQWTASSADGHKTHPFYDALDRLDQGTPTVRWRRLRVFTSTDRKAPPGSFSAAMSDVTVRASSSGGVLWQSSVNVLGEIFVRRADNETFTLEVLQTPPLTYPPPASPPAAPPAPVTCKIAPFPTGTAANSLSRTWSPPPSAGKIAPSIGIRAEINFDGDPLLDPLTKLESGMEDFRGLTVIRPTKHTAGRVISKRQLIAPLQRYLASFGFGSTRTPAASYTVAVRHAVREFQREAKMTTIGGQPSRVSGGVPVAAATIVPFGGAINGTADIPTLTEMRVWKDKNYRAALNFNVKRGATTVQDVGYADASTVGWEVLIAPAQAFGMSTRFTAGQTFYGMGNVMRPADIARGRKPGDELNDPARAAQYTYLKTWEKRVILAVVNNESKIFEAINTYDNAFLTAGAIQWTAGTRSNRGELPGILSTLPAADFQRLFGVWGLGTTDIVGRPFVDVIGGRFTLDGKTLNIPDQKDELRGFRWAHRFVEAAKDNVYREIQIRHAHTRIAAMLRTPLRWGSSRITVESVLQSEMMRALALDEHVNTGSVQHILQRLIDGLRMPAQIITINADGTFGGKWYEEQRKPKLDAELKAKAKAAGVKVSKVSLTPAEISTIDFSLLPLIEELLLLRYQCENPTATPDDLVEVIGALGLSAAAALVTQANTPALTVTSGKLAAMTMEQHSTAFVLYLWLRQHVSRMVGPTERWDRIVAGGYAGALGDPSNAPGVFTP